MKGKRCCRCGRKKARMAPRVYVCLVCMPWYAGICRKCRRQRWVCGACR